MLSEQDQQIYKKDRIHGQIDINVLYNMYQAKTTTKLPIHSFIEAFKLWCRVISPQKFAGRRSFNIPTVLLDKIFNTIEHEHQMTSLINNKGQTIKIWQNT